MNTQIPKKDLKPRGHKRGCPDTFVPTPLTLDVEVNAEGGKSVYLIRDEGGRRIAGPKAWGGSRNLSHFEFDAEELLRFIVGDVPELVPRLVKALRERKAMGKV